MSDPQQIDLLEFERLREEVDNRTELSNHLVSYQLTALGAGIAVFDKFPDVLLGLAAISSFLWLLWIDHTSQIYKIATYIALRLAPRLDGKRTGSLGWERFLRELDTGGKSAAQVLYERTPVKAVDISRTQSVGSYITLLFGGSTPVLIGIYIATQFGHLTGAGMGNYVRVAAVLAGTGIWLFAIQQLRLFNRMIMAFRDAILQRADPVAVAVPPSAPAQQTG
jgi:hypothetical protein